jgi:hypothetical protein
MTVPGLELAMVHKKTCQEIYAIHIQGVCKSLERETSYV